MIRRESLRERLRRAPLCCRGSIGQYPRAALRRGNRAGTLAGAVSPIRVLPSSFASRRGRAVSTPPASHRLPCRPAAWCISRKGNGSLPGNFSLLSCRRALSPWCPPGPTYGIRDSCPALPIFQRRLSSARHATSTNSSRAHTIGFAICLCRWHCAARWRYSLFLHRE